MEKFVTIVDYLWARKSVYKERIPFRELQDVKKSLKNSTFQFSSMFRSWIPKPNKPGKQRAITQPNKADIIVMDTLSLLLNVVFEDIFLPSSHGWRKGFQP